MRKEATRRLAKTLGLPNLVASLLGIEGLRPEQEVQ